MIGPSASAEPLRVRGSRIAFVHGSNDLYGASRVLVGDVTLMLEQGADVAVLLPGKGPLDELLAKLGAHVHTVPLHVLRRVEPTKLRLPVRLPPALPAADLVVVWTLALAAYLPALASRRKAVVCSVHEILPGAAGAMLAAGTTACAPRLMVNSRATGAWIRRHRVRNPPQEVAYPIAPRHDPLPFPERGPIRMLVAGRVNDHKGQREAVAAVELVRQSGLEVELTLAGGTHPGQERHLRALLDDLRSRPWARYAGEVPDTRPLLAQAHALLVPTLRPESFGIVALEAWSAGRRVVASDEGGLAEAARLVDGVTFAPRDIGAMASAIADLVTRPELLAPPRADAPVVAACSAEARLRAWAALLHA